MVSSSPGLALRVHPRVSLPVPSLSAYGAHEGPTLASVDWTPSPSAAAAALSNGRDENALFFGDDTVVDDPYGFAIDDDDDDLEDLDGLDDDVDSLAETLVLRADNPVERELLAKYALELRTKPASLPGFRPPSELGGLVQHTPVPAAPPVRAPQSAAPWWTKPKYHWVIGGCAFLLSGALWAAFAWFLSRS